MSGAGNDGPRDRATIERELRMLASVRGASRRDGGTMPSIDQLDALLDELIEVGTGGGKHRRENVNPDARPSLWQ